MSHRIYALGLISAMTALLLPAVGARGGVVFDLTFQTSPAAPGNYSSFEVDIVPDPDPDATDDVVIGAFSISITIAGTTDVRFIGASSGTMLPYIFPDDFPPGFTADLVGNTITVSDLDFNPGEFFAHDGTGFGLATVFYFIDPAATSPSVTATFTDLGGGTSFSDDLGNDISNFTAFDGRIPIDQPSAVPEPSTIGATALGTMIMLAIRRKRMKNRM